MDSGSPEESEALRTNVSGARPSAGPREDVGCQFEHGQHVPNPQRAQRRRLPAADLVISTGGVMVASASAEPSNPVTALRSMLW